MKKLLVLVAASLVSGAAFGQSLRAPVTEVIAIKTQVAVPTTTQVCSTSQVPVYQEGSTGDVFLGAVIGGIIGNQIGEGKGKDAATVLGTVMGADQGRRANRTIVGYKNVQNCVPQTTYQYEDRVQGYNVRYEYEGQTKTVFLNQHPGDYVTVTVNYSVR